MAVSMHGEGPERSDAAGFPPATEESQAGEDLRGAPRFTLLLRVAKLIVDGREMFCVIRDASTTGLKVRLFTPLPPHAELAVEMANGDRHRARCVWSADDHAGLQFAMPVPLEQLLEEAKSSGQRRHVRLRLMLDGMLHSGGKIAPIRLYDISQQGAGIDSDKWLLLHELVKIESAMLPPVYAKVRWRDHPRYGVVFEQTFQLESLARACHSVAAPAEPAHRAERNS